MRWSFSSVVWLRIHGPKSGVLAPFTILCVVDSMPTFKELVQIYHHTCYSIRSFRYTASLPLLLSQPLCDTVTRCHCRGVSRTPHHPYYLPKAQISKHLSVLSLVCVRRSKSLLLTPPSSKGGGECGRPLCSDFWVSIRVSGGWGEPSLQELEGNM